MMPPDQPTILFLSTMNGDPWGGSEEAWFRLACYLPRNGYNIDCAFYGWQTGKDDRIHQLQEAGCQITILDNYKNASGFFRRLFMKRRAKAQLHELLKEKRFHLNIISQGGFLDVTYAPFHNLRQLMGAYILISHNYNESVPLKKNRRNRLRQWTSNARLNMADAQRTLKAIEKLGGFSLPRQEVMINPLMIPLLPEPAPWPGLQHGNFVFTVMAQLDVHRKAQDVLINALSQTKWRERNWELRIYGAGNDRTLLEQLISEKGLSNKIFLMGHTNDTAAAYRNTHLLLQITHIDSMPLSVTEALSMGRPCVVSRVGDMPVWIADGQNGYLADEVTVNGIDQVLERAWADRAHWESLGKKAYAGFVQKYPQHYEAFYEALFSGHLSP
jgi:glycosyltransferase involved in cell wall biosynthesis